MILTKKLLKWAWFIVWGWTTCVMRLKKRFNLHGINFLYHKNYVFYKVIAVPALVWFWLLDFNNRKAEDNWSSGKEISMCCCWVHFTRLENNKNIWEKLIKSKKLLNIDASYWCLDEMNDRWISKQPSNKYHGIYMKCWTISKVVDQTWVQNKLLGADDDDRRPRFC